MVDSDTDLESDNGEDRTMMRRPNAFTTTVQSTFGWSPMLARHIRHSNWRFLFFYFSLFLLDLTDVVLDGILSVTKLIEGQISWGVFLAIATLLGRTISGLYGWSEVKDRPNPDAASVRFAIQQIAVFFLEDSASILVLANSTNSTLLLERLNLYSTLVSGGCYLMYFVWIWVGILCSQGMDCNRVRMLYFLAGSVVFQIYILVTQVLGRKEGDEPLSGGMETAAFAVYVVNAVFWGGLAVATFYNS